MSTPPSGTAKTTAARTTKTAAPRTPAAASKASTGRLKMMEDLQNSIMELDLSSTDDLREFCEAVRKLLHFVGVTVSMAAGQMKVHARRQARRDSDGVLDTRQRLVLRGVLMKVGRMLEASANHAGDGAVSAIKAWSEMEVFIADVQEGGTGKVTRQQRKANDKGSSFHVNLGSK